MSTEPETTKDDDETDGFPALTEMLGVSLITGVVAVPLIMPLPKEEGAARRALLAKFQLHDVDDTVLYDAMVPLDVLTMLSLNLVKACETAFENVGNLIEEDLLFVNLAELLEHTQAARNSLETLVKQFSK